MRDAAIRWMQHYITAWNSNEPDDIRALFTEDAEYFTSPHEAEPWRGRERIVEGWVAARDEPGDWSFEWKLLGVDGGRAFVQGRTTYQRDHRSYDNLWVIQLTADGRASSFTEWYMPRK
ncbi:ketosteroid isomerase-like protein [Arthrobacter sp. V4I6]|uniref:nuclear transport factor 2 family protein n=1 Tax=unclassified Arthrobacter TaxID=235627 RepID=UPI00277E4E54|nr:MULTISPECIES: nuclear transport factor 2 family protein [unclassified Arthrobacter]MDQ0823576.1 ketosteroid isomerase-like protein [Arthrobacter sp. V1I7]MDQ0853211.1 ketosteroid isomerase-like protein [Arthrobacter sp. V4I6]